MKITKIEEDDTKIVYNVKIRSRNTSGEEPTKSISSKKLLAIIDIDPSAMTSIEGLNLSNKTSNIDTNYTIYKLQKNNSVVATIDNVDNVTKVKRTTNRKKSSKNNETNKTTI